MGIQAVNVLAFGSAVEALGWTERRVPLPAGATLGDVLSALERDFPRLAEGRGRLKFAVNQRYATAATTLNPGDEIAIIPPVAGGDVAADERPAARLVRDPINVAALAREVEADSVGAIATFAGTVRAERRPDGAPLNALEYSAYEPMALAEMQRLCDAVSRDYALQRAVLVHRLGVLAVGEASVAVVVSAGHRGAALDACRALIEGLKAAVPIFKKELWQGGESSWVEPQ